jgi:hypothetical protein
MHARDRNIFILLVNYLPSGRSSDGLQDALDRSEQTLLFEELARIDADKYSLSHRAIFPYAGGVPCSIRGTGVFVKIAGNVFLQVLQEHKIIISMSRPGTPYDNAKAERFMRTLK